MIKNCDEDSFQSSLLRNFFCKPEKIEAGDYKNGLSILVTEELLLQVSHHEGNQIRDLRFQSSLLRNFFCKTPSPRKRARWKGRLSILVTEELLLQDT